APSWEFRYRIGRIVRNVLPDERVLTGILVAVLLLPGLAFAAGKARAYQIRTGHSATAVVLERSQLPHVRAPVAYFGSRGRVFCPLRGLYRIGGALSSRR